jgi:hypothetical protein
VIKTIPHANLKPLPPPSHIHEYDDWVELHLLTANGCRSVWLPPME